MRRSKKETTVPRGNFELRRAASEDCEDLWNWRNDPVTRRNSLKNARVPRKDHERWFRESLKDKNLSILVATERTQKIGMVRVESIQRSLVEISINLNPKFRGKGYGKRILRTVSNRLARRRSKTLQKAIIKFSNKTSQKLFSSVGFIPLHEDSAARYGIWVRP